MTSLFLFVDQRAYNKVKHKNIIYKKYRDIFGSSSSMRSTMSARIFLLNKYERGGSEKEKKKRGNMIIIGLATIRGILLILRWRCGRRLRFIARRC